MVALGQTLRQRVESGDFADAMRIDGIGVTGVNGGLDQRRPLPCENFAILAAGDLQRSGRGRPPPGPCGVSQLQASARQQPLSLGWRILLNLHHPPMLGAHGLEPKLALIRR